MARGTTAGPFSCAPSMIDSLEVEAAGETIGLFFFLIAGHYDQSRLA
jgi:hypothetical protein